MSPAKRPAPVRQSAPATRRRKTHLRLHQDLATLRVDLDRILDEVRVKLHKRLEEVVAVLGAPAEVPSGKLTLDLAERLQAQLQALKVRPAKGRVKDLGRIADLLDSLRKALRHVR